MSILVSRAAATTVSFATPQEVIISQADDSIKAYLYDSSGNGITSTLVSAKRSIDVNVTQTVGSTGGATEVTLAKLTQTQGSTTSGQSGPLVQGAVTTSAPSYTNGQTDPISLTTVGALRVDGSGVTQPVSGTITANFVQSSFNTGSKSSIGTSAVQLTASSTVVKIGITIKAANANTGIVYIGNSSITAGTTDATDGFEIAGGESITLEVDNVNKIYAIGSATGQKVYWTAV